MNKYLLTILCILIVSAGISSVSAADFNTTADNDFVQTQIDNNTQISTQKHNMTAETQNNDTTQNSEKIAQILDNTTVTNSDDEKANTQNTVVVDNGDGFNRLTPEDIQHFQERKEDDPHKLPINKHVKADIDNNMDTI